MGQRLNVKTAPAGSVPKRQNVISYGQILNGKVEQEKLFSVDSPEPSAPAGEARAGTQPATSCPTARGFPRAAGLQATELEAQRREGDPPSCLWRLQMTPEG